MSTLHDIISSRDETINTLYLKINALQAEVARLSSENKSIREDNYTSGFDAGFARAVELLRSKATLGLWPTTQEHSCEIWTPTGWADWLEKQVMTDSGDKP